MTAMVAPLQEREEGKWTHKTLNGSTSYREQCSFSPEKGQQPPPTQSDTKVRNIYYVEEPHAENQRIRFHHVVKCS